MIRSWGSVTFRCALGRATALCSWRIGEVIIIVPAVPSLLRGLGPWLHCGFLLKGSPGKRHRLGAGLPVGQLRRQLIGALARPELRVLSDVHRLGLGQQVADFSGQHLLLFGKPGVGHDIVLRGICPHRRPVQRPLPQLHHARGPAELQGLEGNVSEGRQMMFRETGDRAAIRSLRRRQPSE